jgi:hypothetical protein
MKFALTYLNEYSIWNFQPSLLENKLNYQIVLYTYAFNFNESKVFFSVIF